MSKFALSVDIGGTFTDFVLFNLNEGTITATHKVLTNASAPAEGVLQGCRELIEQYDLDPGSVDLLVHSTTLVTNALIERRGAITGLITTKGFRDVLEIGAEQIYDIYDLFAPYPDPLIPRELRLEANERITSDGDVIEPLDEDDVIRAAGALVEQGAQSIAISFLHAYRDAAHEERAAELIRERFPDISLSMSSRVAPLVGEYERTSTVAADAYVKPIVEVYLTDLVAQLRKLGLPRDPFVMLSSGGTGAVSTAAEYPIRLLESGPAAGAIAGQFFGQLAGHEDVIALDMGGTTAKACLIEGGKPGMLQWLEVDRMHRFKPGSGLPVMSPTVDLIEIGAGGGSIAWINELQLLKVGPRSASSDPGPASYGLGGEEPTVTDANLVLGYLGENSFLGGRMQLNSESAKAAIEAKIGDPLGLSVVDAAWGIHSIVNENMASAARLHIIERNRDPREFTMVGFGGAGPAHASAVARLIGARKILFPIAAGVASAIGGLVAPLSFSFTRSFIENLGNLNAKAIATLFAEMEAEAHRVMSSAGVPDNEVVINRSVDLRFAGQYHELDIPIRSMSIDGDWAKQLTEDFISTYRKQYGRELSGLPIESLNWKIEAVGGGAQLTLEQFPLVADGTTPTPISNRPVYFPIPTPAYVECPVYSRDAIEPGAHIEGPAIIEETEATIVLWPGDIARVDEYKTLVVNIVDSSNNENLEQL